MQDKKGFIKNFFTDMRIEDIHFAQIDLDIANLSIADILRNINKTFPLNTRDRNKISSGQKVIAILCKSKYLLPLSGIIIIVAIEDIKLDILSKNYVVISINEKLINSKEDIVNVIDSITMHIIKKYSRDIPKFEKFYLNYLYDEDEMELDEDYEEAY